MPGKKPPVSLRKPPAPAPPEVADRFVGAAAPAPAATPPTSAPPASRASARKAQPRSVVVRGRGTPDERSLRRLTVYLPADLAKQLKVFCVAEELEMSAVITECVERELKRRGA